jgi:hypothetical protein
MLQWIYSGITMVLQWSNSECTVVLQWFCSDFTKELQCSGVTVLLQWYCNVWRDVLYKLLMRSFVLQYAKKHGKVNVRTANIAASSARVLVARPSPAQGTTGSGRDEHES